MKKIIILGHENPDIDSIFSGILLENILKRQKKMVEFIIPDQKIGQETYEIAQKYNIDITKYQKKYCFTDQDQIILVDHHIKRTKGQIIKIFDHHPDKDFEITNQNYINRKACSTTCIIGQEYEEFLDKDNMLLILLAALIDTASFHSVKTEPKDIEWLEKQAKRFNINIIDYYKEGLCLTDMSDFERAIKNNLKKYMIAEKKVESSYIQIENADQKKDIINQLLTYLIDYRKKNDLEIFALLVHNMTNFTTTLYKVYSNKIETMVYDSYTSRGNIVIPEIQEELKVQKTKKYQKS